MDDALIKQYSLMDFLATFKSVQVFSLSPTGKFIFNQGDLFPRNLKGTSFRKFFKEYPSLIQAYKTVKRGIETQCTFKWEEGWYKMELQADEEDGMKGFLYDITATKQEVINEQERTLHLDDYNKDLEKFAHVVSHDLHEPLRVISNFTQLLKHEYNDQLGEEGISYVDYALNGAKLMRKLLDDLLLYNRIGKAGVPFCENDSSDIIYLQIMRLEKLIKERGAVIRVEGTLPNILCDARQIGLVFYHLFENAILFNKSEIPEIIVKAKEEGNAYTFTIKDNGIGIDAKHISTAFQVFRRINHRPDEKHTGIGLALCKKIIERHQGTIDLSSKQGEGTILCFHLRKEIED